MTGPMRKLPVVVVLLVGVGLSRATLAEKPAESTSAAKKPAESASTAKQPAASTAAAKKRASAGILGRLANQKQPTLRFGTPTVRGALDKKAVAKVVKRSTRELLACYRASLEKNDTLSGTATIAFSIGADGKVSVGKATGLDEAARTCITAAFAKLEFGVANADQGTKVSYPLIFKAESQAFASLTGTGDISSGFDDTNALGGLTGGDIGEGSTYGGLGLRGTGPGGGGTGYGTIGLGNYGTIGHGSGTGSGYGVGSGRGGMRGRSGGSQPVRVGQPSATGELDKAIIRRYIKRNINKVRYCYERELVTKKTLQGTVTASFTIGVDGRVRSSTATGMGNKNVESCVASVIARIAFPQPKRGEVIVKYPFTFRSEPPAAGAAKK